MPIWQMFLSAVENAGRLAKSVTSRMFETRSVAAWAAAHCVDKVSAHAGAMAHTNLHEQDTATWKTTDTNTASNWAMPHGAAARYNGGVHVAQGLTNQDFAAKFATTKYSILGADYRL